MTALTTYSGTFKVMNGTIDVSTGHGVVYSVTSNTGCTVAINSSTGVYTISAVTSDTASAVLNAHFSGADYPKVLSIAKSRAGVTGSTGPGGPVIALTADAEAFTFTDGAANPSSQTITFTAARQNTSETVNFTTSPSVTLSGSGLTRTLTNANFGTNKQVVVTATGAITGAADTITIVRLEQTTAAAGATVGAPAGTLVGGTAATTVEDGANRGHAGLDTSGFLTSGLDGGGTATVPITSLLNTQAGTQLSANPEFQGGSSTGYAVYNNAVGTKVTMAIVADATAPNASGSILRVSYDGTGTPNSNPTPEFGGVYQLLGPASGNVSFPGNYAKGTQIQMRVWAKIPAGRTLNYTSNAIGTTGGFAALTSTAGTGSYALYAWLVTIGTSGTFSSTGFLYISGGANSAFSWDVAKYDQLDITSAPRIFAGTGGVIGNPTTGLTVPTSNLLNDSITVSSGLLTNIGTSSVMVDNSFVGIDGTGRLSNGVATSTNTVENTRISLSTGGSLAGAGGGALTIGGLETSFSETLRNSQITVTSGLIGGIGTGTGTAIGNSLITVSSGLIGGIGTGTGTAIGNSLINVTSGLIGGIGTGSGTAVGNSLISLSTGGALAGAGGGSLTIGGLEGAFSETLRNSQINVTSGLIGGIGTGTGTAVGNSLIQISGNTLIGIGTGTGTAVVNAGVSIGSNGALSGAGGGQVLLTGLGYLGDPLATSGRNLIANGGAETGDTTGWQLDLTYYSGATFTSTTAQSHSGQRAFSIAKSSTSDTIQCPARAIPVLPGRKYAFRLWLKGAATSANGLYIGLNRLGAKPTTGFVQASEIIARDDIVTNAACPNVWTNYDIGTWTCPAGTYYVSPSVIPWTSCPSVWFDDVEFFELVDWAAEINGRPANVAALSGSEGINNTLVSIASNGALSGAGGGQATLPGMGFYGDLYATTGENLIANPKYLNSGQGWNLATFSYVVTAGSSAGDPVNYVRRTGVTTGTEAAIYPPNYTQFPVDAGEDFFMSGQFRASGSGARYSYMYYLFYDYAGSVITDGIVYVNPLVGTGWNTLTSGAITAPANTKTVGLIVSIVNTSGSTITADIGNLRFAKSQPGSTRGATWAVDLSGRPANVAALSGSEGINNASVSIASNGALSGAGGGQVTLRGVGFVGDANATTSENAVPALDSAGNGWNNPYGMSNVAGSSAGDPLRFFRYSNLPNGGSFCYIQGPSGGFPVAPGDHMFMDGLFRASGSGTRSGQFILYYCDATNTIIGGGDVATAAISGTGWQRLSYNTSVAPANAVYVTGLWVFFNNSGGTSTIDMGDMRLAKVQRNADVTAETQIGIRCNPTEFVSYDYTGTAKAGQLTRVLTNALIKGGVDVSAAATWSYTPSVCTVTAGSNGAVTLNTVTGIGAYITVSAAYNSKTYVDVIQINKLQDVPPTGGAGATSFGPISVSGTVNETAYTTPFVIAAPTQMATNGSGQVRLIADAGYGVGLNKRVSVTMKWQRCATLAGTYVDAGVSVTGTTAYGGDGSIPLDQDNSAVDGYAATNALCTATTASTTFYWRLVAYFTSITGTNTSVDVAGTASGAQS